MCVASQTGEGLRAAIATRPLLTAEAVCSQLANLFHVRPTEVGLLRLEALALRFIYPLELAHVGSIPLNGTAVAARTARSRRAELFNQFCSVPHWDIFERVRLPQADKNTPAAIQKLMSAPIIAENGDVVGVVQITRKGATNQAAGPDFTQHDLERLKLAATDIAPIMSLLSLPDPKPGRKLSFCT